MRLVQDVLNSGVTIRVPRMLSFLGMRPGTAEEVADRLEHRQELEAELPDADIRLPVRDAADLLELAVFRGLMPADRLPHPELARNLNQMAEHGWSLEDADGHRVGGYGAYNAITEAHAEVRLHRKDFNLSLNEGQLQDMARFYRESPLGQLELQGWEFFDEHGQPRPAWGTQPPHFVGKDGQRWLPTADAAELDAFAILVSETADPELARRVRDVRNLSQARALADQPRALNGLVRNTAHEPLEDVLELTKIEALLPALTQRPDTIRSARMALECLETTQSSRLRKAIYEAFKAHPTVSTGKEAAAFYADLRQGLDRLNSYDHDGLSESARRLAKLMVAHLAEFPDTRATAERVQAWDPQDAHKLWRLLEDPATTDFRALAGSLAGTNDTAMQRRVLEELAPTLPAARLALGLEVHQSRTRNLLFRAALEGPPAGTWEEKLAFLRSAVSQVDATQYYDDGAKQRDTAVLLEAAAREMRGQPALAYLEELQPRDRERALRTVITTPRISKWDLGVTLATRSDQALQRRLLEQLDPLARSLHQQVEDSRTRFIVFQAATQQPEIEDKVAFYRGVLATVDSTHYYNDEAKLKDVQRLLEAVAGELESSPAMRAVQELAPADRNRGIRAVLADPHASKWELGMQLVTRSDQALQRKLLAELDPQESQLARDLYDKVQDSRTRFLVFQAAVKGPQKPVAFYQDVLAQIDATQYYNDESKAKDIQVLLELANQSLQGLPAFAYVEQLQPSDRNRAIRTLLQNPGASSEQELWELGVSLAGRSEPGVQSRLLQKLEPLHNQLHQAVSHPRSRYLVFQAAVQRPRLESGADAADFFQRALGEMERTQYYDDEAKSADVRKLLALARETLALYPDTWRASDYLAEIQPMDPDRGTRALLQAPAATAPEELWKLGAEAAASNDHRLQDRLLGQFPAGRIALAARARLSDSRARHLAFQAAQDRPEPRTGAEAASYFSQVFEALDRKQFYDDDLKQRELRGLADAVLEQLAAFPDSARAVGLIQGWNPSDRVQAARAVLEQPAVESQVDELKLAARLCGAGDAAMQESLLRKLEQQPETQLAARIARDVASQMTTAKGKLAPVLTALEHPELATREDIDTFFETLKSKTPKNERDRLEGLAEAAREVLLLMQKPDPSAIREEDERVIVGGVTVKKRA